MIKRYEYTYTSDMIEDTEGEWVRWEDVCARWKEDMEAILDELHELKERTNLLYSVVDNSSFYHPNMFRPSKALKNERRKIDAI